MQIPHTKSTHYIYFKRHDSKANAQVSQRSIFFCNLPIQTTVSGLKKYFQHVAIGATIEAYVPSRLNDFPEDVWIDLTELTTDLELTKREVTVSEDAKLPKNCGIVTFIDKAASQLAFSALKKLSSNSTTSPWPVSSNLASASYVAQLQAQILDPEQLSLDVAQSLVDFDRAEQESMDNFKRQTQLVDDDGFTLVVGPNRKTKAEILGRQKLASTVDLDRANAKLKKKEQVDFYRFQLRQKKKEEMNDLLQKFKLDQERVRTMTERKRFKPY